MIIAWCRFYVKIVCNWLFFKTLFQATLSRRPVADKPYLLKKAFARNDLVELSKKEKWKQWTTIGGFQSFTEAIARYLVNDMGIKVYRGTEVESAVLRSDHKIKLNLNCYGTTDAEVILTLRFIDVLCANS